MLEVYIIGMNIILTTLFAIHHRKDDQLLAKSVISFCLPFLGILIFYIDELANHFRKKPENMLKELNKLFEKANQFDHVLDCTSASYTKTLSIQNAFEIKDVKQKREFLFNAFKGDFQRIYPFLIQALRDPDNEIVHYASSVLSEMRQRINSNFVLFRGEYERNPQNDVNCRRYADNICEWLFLANINQESAEEKQKILFDVFQHMMKYKMLNEEKYYIYKIENEVNLRKFIHAHETATHYLKEYPFSENANLQVLKFYYIMKDFGCFYELLSKLKNKNLIKTTKGKNRVSFWVERNCDLVKGSYSV